MPSTNKYSNTGHFHHCIRVDHESANSFCTRAELLSKCCTHNIANKAETYDLERGNDLVCLTSDWAILHKLGSSF